MAQFMQNQVLDAIQSQCSCYLEDFLLGIQKLQNQISERSIDPIVLELVENLELEIIKNSIK